MRWPDPHSETHFPDPTLGASEADTDTGDRAGVVTGKPFLVEEAKKSTC